MNLPSVESDVFIKAAGAAKRSGAPTADRALPRNAVVLGVVGFVLLGYVIRMPYLQQTLVVVDEFQHLHAAYAVSQGQIPYADFFEHHTPLFYYLAAALLPMDTASFDTIIAARHLALIFATFTIVVAWWWVRRVFGRTEAVVTAALLAANFFLFARSALVYLDSYAAPFVVLSAALLCGSRGKPWRAAGSALALGTAVLFTQKAIVAGLAPLAWFACRLLDDAPRSRWWKDLAGYTFGGLAAALMIPLLIGVGAVDDFWYSNVTMNLAWKAKRFPARELAILAATDGFVYLLAAAGSAVTLHDCWRRRLRLRDDDMPVLYLAALAAGIFLMPVVWEEYFIQVVPFAVVVGAVTLVRTAQRCRSSDGRFHAFRPGTSRSASIVLILAAAVMVADLVGRVIVGEQRMSGYAAAGTVALWLALGAYIASGRAAASLVPWFALVLVFPIMQELDWIEHNSNQRQRQRIEYILRETRPSDAVFDGYSGFGLFRPHAYRYWFLHEEVLPMLSPEERGVDIIHALEQREPRIVISDRYVRMLPESVREYIDANYEDTPFPEIKRRRSAAAVAFEERSTEQ